MSVNKRYSNKFADKKKFKYVKYNLRSLTI